MPRDALRGVRIDVHAAYRIAHHMRCGRSMIIDVPGRATDN